MNYICAQTLHSLLSASSTVTQTYNTSFKWLFWWLTSGPLFIFNIHLQLKKFGHKSEVSLDVAVGRWFQLQLPFLLFLTCIDVNLIKEDHRSSMKTYTDVYSHTSAIAMLLHVPHAALLVAFMNLIPNHLQLFETPLRQRCSTHLQNRYNNTVREILHPKMHILSSPSFCSKAVWLSFFCGTQKKMFWEMSQGFFGAPMLFGYHSQHSSKQHILGSMEDRKSHRSGTTWGWVNIDTIQQTLLTYLYTHTQLY